MTIETMCRSMIFFKQTTSETTIVSLPYPCVLLDASHATSRTNRLLSFEPFWKRDETCCDQTISFPTTSPTSTIRSGLEVEVHVLIPQFHGLNFHARNIEKITAKELLPQNLFLDFLGM